MAENEKATPSRGAVALPLPLLIGIVLAVALLVGGGSVAAILMLQPKAPVSTEQSDNADGLEDERPAEGGAFYSIEDPFIVNLEPSQEFPYSYLKFAVSLEVTDTQAADALGAKLPKLKSIINGIMNNVAYASISTEAGQRKYATKLLEALNVAFTPPADSKTGKAGTPPVVQVHFTTLVAQ